MQNTTKSIQWKAGTSVSSMPLFFTATIGDTRYWVVRNRLTNVWTVEDSHGAVWGSFATSEQGKQAVETL